MTCTLQDGLLCVDGYAAVEDERFESVDTRVVLYHSGTNSYLLLPTQMQSSEAARQATGLPLAEYCLLYTSRGTRVVCKFARAEYALCAAGLLRKPPLRRCAGTTGSSAEGSGICVDVYKRQILQTTIITTPDMIC